jgi:predicted HTH domain antitoxin
MNFEGLGAWKDAATGGWIFRQTSYFILDLSNSWNHVWFMNTFTLQYPENLPDSARLSRQEFENTMRFAMAAKLFELGRVSSGQAAQLVPMDRYTFLKSLNQVGISAIQWDAVEFACEVDHA